MKNENRSLLLIEALELGWRLDRIWADTPDGAEFNEVYDRLGKLRKKAWERVERRTEAQTREKQLINVARQYVEMESGPKSEIVGDKLFDLAAQVTKPSTQAGAAIIDWVKKEQDTDFSLAAGDEFDEMRSALILGNGQDGEM
jgi:hypothetical protein